MLLQELSPPIQSPPQLTRHPQQLERATAGSHDGDPQLYVHSRSKERADAQWSRPPRPAEQLYFIDQKWTTLTKAEYDTVPERKHERKKPRCTYI